MFELRSQDQISEQLPTPELNPKPKLDPPTYNSNPPLPNKMALTPRHKFVVSRIEECFEGLDNQRVQTFIRKNENIARLNSLFNGEGCNKIFVHFQSKSNAGDAPTEFNQHPTTSEPDLFFSNGDANYMNSKCCYFLRSGGAKPISVEVGNDKSLLYGEVSDSPLQTIEALLSGSFDGLFAQSAEWGKVSCAENR